MKSRTISVTENITFLTNGQLLPLMRRQAQNSTRILALSLIVQALGIVAYQNPIVCVSAILWKWFRFVNTKICSYVNTKSNSASSNIWYEYFKK